MTFARFAAPTRINCTDRTPARGRGRLFNIAVAVCALGATAPAASASTWTNGGGDGLWSNSLNWNGSASSVYRHFTDTAVGASTANANRSAWVFYVTNASGTHAVNIASGTISLNTFAGLEIGNSGTGAIEFSNGTFSVAQPGSSQLRLGYANAASANGTLIGTSSLVANMGFRNLSTVGYSENANTASAKLDMGASDNGSLTFAALRAGWANGTGAASSDMSFGDNWTFNVGTSGTRGELALGYVVSTGSASSSFTAGTGGSFTAYANSFHAGGGNNVTTTRNSTVDLSGMDGGLIDVSSASNRQFNIGRGAGTSSVDLGSNWTVNVALNHTMLIGTDGGTGSLVGNNLTLSGSAGFLYVGAHDESTATGAGLLDMGGGSFGTGLTVGSIRVGFGGSSSGTARLGSGTFAFTGSADIGDAGASGVEGLVELDGTDWTGGASAVVNVNNSGRLNIFVNGTSSGLILNRAASAALTIADTVANGNGILATFQSNPTGYDYLGTAGDPIYWAIKWAGDQQTSLQSFVTAGKIAYDTSSLTGGLASATPQVIYDSVANETYYGIYVSAVPEPGSLALAAGGLAIAGWSLRRRRSCRAA
jgi:hypothetical protein